MSTSVATKPYIALVFSLDRHAIHSDSRGWCHYSATCCAIERPIWRWARAVVIMATEITESEIVVFACATNASRALG